MTGVFDDAVDAAARLLIEADYVAAIVGAGMSVESGIPTFRGPDGIWARLGKPSVSSYKQFRDDPSAWWRQQLDRDSDPTRTEFRDAIDRATPNSGHYALAEFEGLGVLKHTITQNVDDLHQKAGSSSVTEIHGNRTKLRCVGCESRWPRDEFPIRRYPPRCPECGDYVKVDTVMFGEPIPRGVLDSCSEIADLCDCMIAAGTSATVYPAANYPNRVLARGGRLIEVNPNPTRLSDRCDVVLRGPTGEVLPRIVARVGELLGSAMGSGHTAAEYGEAAAHA